MKTPVSCVRSLAGLSPNDAVHRIISKSEVFLRNALFRPAPPGVTRYVCAAFEVETGPEHTSESA
jgi:hypothetical protein